MNRYSRRRATDTALRRVITAGGLLIIASILTMLAFLIFETIPLWQGAETHSQTIESGSEGTLVLVNANEYQEVFFGLDRTGTAIAFSSDGTRAARNEVTPEVASVVESHGTWIVASADGVITPVTPEDGAYFEGSTRKYRPSFDVGQSAQVDTSASIALVAGSFQEGALRAAALLSDARMVILDRSVEESLFGDAEVTDTVHGLPLPANTQVKSMVLTGDRRFLYVGTGAGTLLEFDLVRERRLIGTYQVGPSAVTSLGLLLGGNSVVVGTADGSVSVWFRAPDENDELHLVHAHHFDPHAGEVQGSAASLRNRSFVTWDASGELNLHYGTTSQTRARIRANSPLLQASIAPKSDGIVGVLQDGSVEHWDLEDPHPEISARTLFGRVHYERFQEPEFKWQSTGGTDASETKLSLVPLIFGSLKGTLYAMLFSAPIAILAALYTSVFMHARLRSIVKPTMELMATIPSVVLGLLAGLWLAPRLETGMPILLLSGLLLPALTLLAGALSVYVPAGWKRGAKPGVESIVLIPILAAGLGIMLASNGWLNGLFDGGFLHWMFTEHEIRYDQRNALVVGIAMGLAVIPIIFSVSEDALSSVPRHLTAGSLALGATPWQTAWRVVLPAASPGIFSALMIGFGRAVGETMIILMATGNTPIMDWSLFNGFRTLSANIAVEIPEAPHGGSLYRVLFVSALLLFLFTLVVNTTAEVVSTRLRKRYSRF